MSPRASELNCWNLVISRLWCPEQRWIAREELDNYGGPCTVQMSFLSEGIVGSRNKGAPFLLPRENAKARNRASETCSSAATQVMAESEDQRERRERRNFLKRKRAYDQEKEITEATRAASDMLREASREADEMSRVANEMSREAMREAIEMKRVAILEAKAMKEKAIEKSRLIIRSAKDREKVYDACVSSASKRWQDLEKQINSLEGRLAEFSVQSGKPVKTPDEMREMNATRQRKAYWKGVDLRELERQAIASSMRNQGIVPNRNLRMCKVIACDVLQSFLAKTKSYNTASKKQVLKIFWQSASLKHLHPAKFGCPKIDASVKTSFEHLKSTLQVVKGAHRKDHMAAKHNILASLTGNQVVRNQFKTSLAKALGIKRDNLIKAAKNRSRLDANAAERFPMGVRRTRSDRISKETRMDVAVWWENNTRVSPCSKDEARFRLDVKVYEHHQIHWLEETEAELYLRYQGWCEEQAKPVPVGLRTFQYCKPYFIRVLKDRNVCCCKAHVEIDLLKQALSRWRERKHDASTCHCTCFCCMQTFPCMVVDTSTIVKCEAPKALISSVREWCEDIVCPKAKGEIWHKKDCIIGKCKDCGVKKLGICPTELASDVPISWQTFQYTQLEKSGQKKTVRDNDGEDKPGKRLRMLYMETTMAQFLQKVQITMPSFVQHNFRARWQASEYKRSHATFSKGTILSSIDFSENYTFLVQDEIQSMHWDNKQITILVHATFRHREEHEYKDGEERPGSTDRDIITDYHFYISDDNTHDSLFVQHCMDMHVNWVRDQGISFDRHWVWSDGCAAQFKSRGPFYFVSRYFHTYGAKMQWNFHGSGHGKNVVDGEGGSQKRALAKEQLLGIRGHKLQNANDAVEFLREKFAFGKETGPGQFQEVRRHHWEIKVGEVNRAKTWDCQPIQGSRSLHCFVGPKEDRPTLLRVRELCCFCPTCVDEDDSVTCPNVEWAGPWTVEEIAPKVPSDVSENIEQLGTGTGIHDWEDDELELADCIEVGDFFAVEADRSDDFNEDFYILQCEQEVHYCETGFVDPWGQAFQVGERVLKGLWYQKYGKGATKYVMSRRSPRSWVSARSVIHTRFLLRPAGRCGADNAFTLPSDTLEQIMGSLVSVRSQEF